MTGSRSFEVRAGDQRFRYRQSSFTFGGAPNMTAIAGSCMQPGAKVSACLVPDQLTTGCGGRQRCSPVGGAANGIPLKETMLPLATPCTVPPVTLAVKTCASTQEPRAAANVNKHARICFFTWMIPPFFMPRVKSYAACLDNMGIQPVA